VIDQGRSHPGVLVAHDRSATIELVRMHERLQRRPPLVLDPRSDIVFVQLEEQLRHLYERRWSPGVNAGDKPGRPGQQDQVAVIGIVGGMVGSDKNVWQL